MLPSSTSLYSKTQKETRQTKPSETISLMGRQSGDPTMVSSSIALLQERFRQLQRVREKREEKELLKLFSDAAPAAARYDPNRLSLQPDINASHRPLLHASTSLGLTSQTRLADHRATMISTSSSLWPDSAATTSASRNLDSPDVDTSLHL